MRSYTCRRCGRSAYWTDGPSVALGDDRDEFWCQVCGYEQPLPPPDRESDVAKMMVVVGLGAAAAIIIFTIIAAVVNFG